MAVFMASTVDVTVKSPVMPKVVSSAAVTFVVPWLAAAMTSLAALAMACSSGSVSTAAAGLASTALSSRNTLVPATGADVPLTPVTPTSAYWLPVIAVEVFPATPSALARRAL